jgi:hypothetical protein
MNSPHFLSAHHHMGLPDHSRQSTQEKDISILANPDITKLAADVIELLGEEPTGPVVL